MANGKRQHFPKTNWTKKVLVPFWVLELIWAFITFVFACISLTTAYSPYWDSRVANCSGFQRRYQAGSALALIWSLAALGMAISEIVLFSRSELWPKLYLIFACVKATGWLVLFLITLFAAYTSFFSCIFVLVLLATGVGQTIYGGVIYHRFRKGRLNLDFNNGSEMGRSSPAPAGSYAGHNPRSTRLEPMTSENPFKDLSPSSRSLATSLQGMAPPAYDPTRVV